MLARSRFPRGFTGEPIHSSETTWSFDSVATREEGATELKKLLGQSDVLEVVLESGPKQGIRVGQNKA